MTTFESKYITASPTIISKASRLFDASVCTILCELVQNARRAGAKNVYLDYHQERNEITVTDDGPGMFQDDVSITLSDSGWSEEIISSEDTAGMGLFSMAAVGCMIQANGKKVKVSAAAFNGEEPMEIEEDFSITSGTRITFPVKDSNTALSGFGFFKQAMAYDCGINVYVEQEIFKPSDIFKPNVRRDNLDDKDTFDKVWEVPFKNLDIRIYRRSGEQYCKSRALIFDFKGLKIEISVARGISTVLRVFDNRYFVRVQLKNTADLKLKLPDRKEVVQDEQWNALIRHIEDELCKIVSEEGHTLSYREYKQLIDLGHRIPEARPEGTDRYVLDHLNECFIFEETVQIEFWDQYYTAKNERFVDAWNLSSGYSWSKVFDDRCVDYEKSFICSGNDPIISWLDYLSVDLTREEAKKQFVLVSDLNLFLETEGGHQLRVPLPAFYGTEQVASWYAREGTYIFIDKDAPYLDVESVVFHNVFSRAIAESDYPENQDDIFFDDMRETLSSVIQMDLQTANTVVLSTGKRANFGVSKNILFFFARIPSEDPNYPELEIAGTSSDGLKVLSGTLTIKQQLNLIYAILDWRAVFIPLILFLLGLAIITPR